MCGIVGYTGFRDAVSVVYDGLKTLEYRGYDSAGIAIASDHLQVFKQTGRVSALKDKLPTDTYHTAIGHTRWATHGIPLEKNAHPHLSYDGKIAVVHNGIIENYKELKRALEKNGVRFVSDTDSEVIAHLLAMQNTNDFLQAIKNVNLMLDGEATFLAIREGDAKIYCSKRGASLGIGIGNSENFVASDTLAICNYLDSVIPLKDNDIAMIDKTSVEIWNSNKIVNRPAYPINRTLPKDSNCFMRSEIDEIPLAIKRTIDKFLSTDNKIAEEKIKNANKLFFVGCGTAYHACLYGKYLFSHLLNKNCDAVESSEFDETLIDETCVAIFISQSGETLDTVLATNKCNSKGGFSIAVCNVTGSLLSFTAKANYFIDAGAEVAVAATKSYVCQLALLFLLAKKCEGTKSDEKFKTQLVDQLDNTLGLNLFSPELANKKLFFIGKGLDVVTAKEAALKVKEITYKMTDAYPAGELKHGPIALIDNDSVAVIVATNKNDKGRIEATASELRSRGATVLAVSGIGDIGADKTVHLPMPNDNNLFPLIAIIPLQSLALDLALALKLDPDKPRNLAKSVTVV